MSDALVLAGHGSRAAEANASLETLARSLADELDRAVYPAYLEMADPDIPSALRAARDAGATRIVVVPYFLSPGMHVRRDLVAIAVAGRAELGVAIELSAFLGAHPLVPALLAELARHALSAAPAAATDPP